MSVNNIYLDINIRLRSENQKTCKNTKSSIYYGLFKCN